MLKLQRKENFYVKVFLFFFQTIFKECSRAKDKNSFSLLIQVLSDIVPYYKDIEYIRVSFRNISFISSWLNLV